MELRHSEGIAARPLLSCGNSFQWESYSFKGDVTMKLSKYNISKCQTVFKICGGHMHQVQYITGKKSGYRTVEASSLKHLELLVAEYAETLKSEEFTADCYSIMVHKPNGTRAFPGFKKAADGPSLKFLVNEEQAQKRAICEFYRHKSERPDHPARQYDEFVTSCIDAGRYPRPSEDEIHAYKNWLIENQLAV